MIVFMRSYRPAIRSNIACTCGSSSVPGAPRSAEDALAVTGPPRPLLKLGEEADEVVELLRILLGQALERRHRGGRVVQSLRDRGRAQLGSDVGQLRSGSVVAVLAELVAGQAARLADHELAGVERLDLRRGQRRRRLHVDLVRRPGR